MLHDGLVARGMRGGVRLQLTEGRIQGRLDHRGGHRLGSTLLQGRGAINLIEEARGGGGYTGGVLSYH